jgi:Fe-S-cluster containining protein
MAASMKEIEKLKKTILEEYPRLSKTSRFQFKCHPGVACFNDCCADVNIFLTPYDIIRLKNSLGISSKEFLSKYTISPFDENLKYPVVLLKMEENEKKSCPFVASNGCQVYEDRPWSCRMYPLGLASSKDKKESGDNEFFFLLKEAVCQGFKEEKEQSVDEWLKDQGITEYDRMGEHFKQISLHDFFEKGGNLPPEKIEMFFMTCYNIDSFRKFIFESSFLEKFEIDDDTKAAIKQNDVELMKFGFKWLRFSLFGEKTIKVKNDVLASKKEELKTKGKLKE